MLTLPDLKEKKIVFIPSSEDIENSLSLRNNNICLYKGGKLINKITCNQVISLYILGDCTVTTRLMNTLKSNGISIFFLNYSFKNIGYINSIAEGNTKLRQVQYTLTELENLALSKIIIENKIKNQHAIIKKLKKDTGRELYRNTIDGIRKCKSTKSLLGLEGNYSKFYFKTIFREIGWYRRAPRTKEDIPNLLLDIGYTFLFNFVDSLLLLFGFDTYKGMYHQLFFQRKSLSCDIVEIFRPLIDYQLVKSYHLKQINEKDFKFKNGFFYFKDFNIQKKYTKIWFDLLMENKEDIYLYIMDFYRYLLNNKRYSKPKYTIK